MELKASWKNAKLQPVRENLEISVSGAVGEPMVLTSKGVSVSLIRDA